MQPITLAIAVALFACASLFPHSFVRLVSVTLVAISIALGFLVFCGLWTVTVVNHPFFAEIVWSRNERLRLIDLTNSVNFWSYIFVLLLLILFLFGAHWAFWKKTV